MKKIINYAFLLLIVASVASCGGGSKKDVTTPTPPDPPKPPTKPVEPKDSSYMNLVGDTVVFLPLGKDTLMAICDVHLGGDISANWHTLQGLPPLPYVTNRYYWIQDSTGKTVKEGAFVSDKQYADLGNWKPPYNKGNYRIKYGIKATGKTGDNIVLVPLIRLEKNGTILNDGIGCVGPRIVIN